MTEESRLLMTIWDRFADFISAGEKQQAAEALVAAFLDEGTDLSNLLDAEGECNNIDRALAEQKDLDEPFIDDLYGDEDD